MFVQESRNFVSSTSNSTTNQMRIDFDNDKIKINKLDIYHEDRNELNNWLTRFDMYSTLNHVLKSKRALIASIFLENRIEAWLKSRIQKYSNENESQDELNKSNQLIEANIELDDKLYEQTMKKCNSISHERFDIYEVFEESYRTQESMSTELILTKRCKEMNLKIKQDNKRKACYMCDKISHFAKNCSKRLMFQRQINATLREILEAKMKWEKVSKINSNEENYCLINNSSKVLTMLEESTLQTIASMKSFNFNSNIVVTSLSKTYSLQYKDENSELEEKFHQIEKLNSRRTIYEQIIDNLERILDNNVSKEREISTQRLENLLDMTVCDECSYMSYRTCTYWKCEEHILKEVAKRRNNNNHEVFDWSLCEKNNCQIHQETRNMSTLTRLEKRYLWLQ